MNLPVEESKPLIEIPEFIPLVGFLGGKEGKEINKEIRAKYKNFSALQKSSYDNGVIKGSNPFYVVAINEIIRSQGLRTATSADLERVLKRDALDLKRHYEDSALVLRSEDNPNAYLAKDLIKQIKQRTGKDRKTSIMIPLAGLELRADQDSEHGLAFNLIDDSEIIYAPQLTHKNDYRKFSEANDKGLPVFDKNGKRTLYTRDSGLSRLHLGDSLDLGSYDDDLAGSYDLGRVVVVNAKGTRANFNEYLAKLQTIRDEKMLEVHERYEKAKAILRAK